MPTDDDPIADGSSPGTRAPRLPRVSGGSDELLPGEAEDRREQIELTSPTFDDGDPLPDRCAHQNENISPALEWTTVPADTAELALLCLDPDSPSGTFTHWVLAGIDPTVTSMDEGQVPPGAVEGVNDFGEMGWGGPQPPPGHGPHRYIFTLLASAVPLDVAPGATVDDVVDAVEGNLLARGELVGTYER